MSGTGPTPAEQHLGDRLAALVDGELKHDARERVLAHLATCPKCKAEADAQRRLKSAFAMSASPSPSEGFLARLQGLPGGPSGGDGGPGGPFGGGGRFADEFFPPMRPSGSSRADTAKGTSPLDTFGFLPTAHGSTAVLPGGGPRGAFRIHDVARDADRSPWRGRRFAFAAASAVSLAAIALGGTLPLDSAPDSALRAEGAGSSVTPIDADARADASNSAASRRGSGGGALALNGGGPATGTAAAPPVAPAATPAPPVLVAVPSLLGAAPLTGHSFALPVLNVSLSPLIRPTGTTPLLAAALGSTPEPKPALPPAPASGMPTNDHALPHSSRR
ncbi:zf-HC2 domain-containing protein [Streptomyces sp. NBC_00654]|uniref:anti-sigma factor family protein n=1 Tax=Streptomyces sp. NBC_00654 TaxID=2975799 RepID=UPI00225BE080|nr:zf-HC2 domain-containing protein [Streptomyces sp. NBC_00654]MCX4964627.1 zf-HC2 domain-containing protein [Streptomyces sp. NBC_00654]